MSSNAPETVPDPQILCPHCGAKGLAAMVVGMDGQKARHCPSCGIDVDLPPPKGQWRLHEKPSRMRAVVIALILAASAFIIIWMQR